MNTARSKQRRSQTATGRLLGVLGLFLFNFVVAPCALALGAGDDCSHCPPEHAAEMAAHHGDHGSMATAGCDALMAGCDDAGSMAHDGRSTQPKPKDEAEPVSMPAPAFPQAPLDSAVFIAMTAGPPVPPGYLPPLHLLNCVFLN